MKLNRVIEMVLENYTEKNSQPNLLSEECRQQIAKDIEIVVYEYFTTSVTEENIYETKSKK